MPRNRWSVFIDVEGFSSIYKVDSARALSLLAWLTRGVYLIAARYPRNDAERLFVHQMGDGFVVVSDSSLVDLSRPVSIAISLMQYLLAVRGVARAGVSAGDFADIRGCLPPEVREVTDNGGCVSIPKGVMHIFPVMGDALINAYKTQANSIKGPLLFVDPNLRRLLTGMNLRFLTKTSCRVVVDWISSDTSLLRGLFTALDRSRPERDALKRVIREYISSNPVSGRWRHNALKMAL